MLEALTDPEPTVRLAAIRTADALITGSPAMTGSVRSLLADPDAGVLAAAAAVILRERDHDDALAVLRAMLRSEDPLPRVLALGALEGSASSDAFDMCAAGLSDHDARVRVAAAQALATADQTRTVPLLVQALDDDDADVRRALARSLGRIGASAADPVLGALFHPATADGALLALEQLPSGPAPDVVRGYAREEAARALADFDASLVIGHDDDDGERLLCDSLMARARIQALRAMRAVALLGDGASIRFAIDNLASHDPAQVANALEALDSLGEHTVVRPLLRLWETGRSPRRPRRCVAVPTAARP